MWYLNSASRESEICVPEDASLSDEGWWNQLGVWNQLSGGIKFYFYCTRVAIVLTSDRFSFNDKQYTWEYVVRWNTVNTTRIYFLIDSNNKFPEADFKQVEQ